MPAERATRSRTGPLSRGQKETRHDPQAPASRFRERPGERSAGQGAVVSQSADIPRPPRTDTARRLLAPRGSCTDAPPPDAPAPSRKDIPDPRPPAAIVAPPVPARTRPLRASDAERESMVRLLHHALGEGRLDLQETETRVAAAYAAVYRSELPALFDDLPQRQEAAEAVLGAPRAPDRRRSGPRWSGGPG